LSGSRSRSDWLMVVVYHRRKVASAGLKNSLRRGKKGLPRSEGGAWRHQARLAAHHPPTTKTGEGGPQVSGIRDDAVKDQSLVRFEAPWLISGRKKTGSHSPREWGRLQYGEGGGGKIDKEVTWAPERQSLPDNSKKEEGSQCSTEVFGNVASNFRQVRLKHLRSYYIGGGDHRLAYLACSNILQGSQGCVRTQAWLVKQKKIRAEVPLSGKREEGDDPDISGDEQSKKVENIFQKNMKSQAAASLPATSGRGGNGSLN